MERGCGMAGQKEDWKTQGAGRWVQSKARIASAVVFFLAACALPISKESLKQVDSAVRFQAVMVDPEKYQGRTLLVGGEILATEVRPGESWVEVLERPLDRWQRRRTNRRGVSG